MSTPKDQLKPGKPGPKQARKIDRQRLAEAIEAQPDRLQEELAADFGVWAIHHACKRLGITRKKTVALE